MPSVACITPSFNKPKWVIEAVRSVMTQTYGNFTYFIIENSTDWKTKWALSDYLEDNPDKRIVYIEENIPDSVREKEYPTALILNKYLPIIKADYIFYLSDDDIFAKDCFEKVVNFLETSQADACYFTMQGVDEAGRDHGQIVADSIKPQGSNLDCQLDGGQVVFRASLLEKLIQPFFVTNYSDAAHCDGLFLNKLSSVTEILPINEVLLTHRRTRQSTWIKGE